METRGFFDYDESLNILYTTLCANTSCPRRYSNVMHAEAPKEGAAAIWIIDGLRRWADNLRTGLLAASSAVTRVTQIVLRDKNTKTGKPPNISPPARLLVKTDAESGFSHDFMGQERVGWMNSAKTRVA
jgi:hypothetical protein